MKSVSLSGVPRAHVGKKDAKKLRREGQVPCVLYGGEEQVFFSVELKLFNKLIYTPEVFSINLNIDGKEYTSIIQEVQFHPVSDDAIHIDFLQIFEDKPIKFKLPVRTTGTSPGVMAGGKLRVKMKKLLVEGLLKDMPEHVTVDISKLNIGDTYLVKDLELENLVAMQNPQEAIVLIKSARDLLELEEEEEEEGEGSEGAEGGEGGDAPAEEKAAE